MHQDVVDIRDDALNPAEDEVNQAGEAGRGPLQSHGGHRPLVMGALAWHCEAGDCPAGNLLGTVARTRK